VFQNRVLRRMFESRRNDVTRDWNKLSNEELHSLYSSPNIIRQLKSRRVRWAGHVARMGQKRKLWQVLVGKSERKGPLGRRRWENGIRMEFSETGWGCVERFRIGTGGELL
jgi:hypothetical protein